MIWVGIRMCGPHWLGRVMCNKERNEGSDDVGIPTDWEEGRHPARPSIISSAGGVRRVGHVPVELCVCVCVCVCVARARREVDGIIIERKERGRWMQR